MLFALGFVFMFTIGGLINHLALPLKIAICWELLTIILLELYTNSVTMYNFEQSAGNQRVFNTLVGSSETTRDPRSLYTRRYSPCNQNTLFRASASFNYNSFNQKTINNLRNHYSTSSKEDNTKHLELAPPLKVYSQFKEDRSNILKEQKDKSAGGAATYACASAAEARRTWPGHASFRAGCLLFN